VKKNGILESVINMLKRLERNLPTLSAAQQQRLMESGAVIVGCGGLGCWLCEYLLRLGVGRLRVIDGDRFEPSNGNRQLYCTGETLGEQKASAAAARALCIAPETGVEAVSELFMAENAGTLLSGAEVVLDALDSPETRILLEDACARLGLPLVHGAVSGWTYQVAVVPPGSGVLRRLYAGRGGSGGSTLSFVPAACAARQAAEAVKLLTGLPSSLEGKLLLADLRTMDAEIVEL